MKIKATKFLKQVWTAMGEVLKSKTSAVKTKVGAVRTRLIILCLLRNKKFILTTISHKFHALLKHEKLDHDDQTAHPNKISNRFQSLLCNRKLEVSKISQKIHALLIGNEKEKEENAEDSKAIVVYNPFSFMPHVPEDCCVDDSANDEFGDEERGEDDDEDDDYPDLTHCLFDSEDLGDPALSVVDVVKQLKDPQDEFVLEDEIDQVADLFIKRFRRQIKMQKQESFKVYRDMLDRSA